MDSKDKYQDLITLLIIIVSSVMSVSRSKWEEFFKAAGIPPKPAADYAIKFSDNRMRHDMLEELNKEVLQELGVKAIGDVIAILRHAKVKQAEMTRRQRSPSPPEVQITTEAKKQKPTRSNNMSAGPSSNNTTTTAQQVDQKHLKSLSMTVNSDSKTKPSKSKQLRKTLSERFGDYEKEAKIQKTENFEKLPPKEITKVAAVPPPTNTKAESTTKNKPTVFTIQLPSKPPQIGNKTTAASTTVTLGSTTKKITEQKREGPKKQQPQKVTLVPAQGKPLNRNKQSTSIFDRLDKTATSKRAAPSVQLIKTVAISPKEKNVFSRLGGVDDNDDDDSDEEVTTATKITRLAQSTKLRDLVKSSTSTQSTSSSTLSSNNVFSRLGDR